MKNIKETKAMEKEDKKAIEQEILNIKFQTEEKQSKITTNKTKKATQYKTTIPKKFADTIKLNKKDFYMTFYLTNQGTIKKPKYKITAEIKNKNETQI